MMVRSTDPDLRDGFDDILNRLVEFDGLDPLLRMTAADVVDLFWPAADGWTTIAVEPGVEYVTWVLTHPTCGVTACMLMTLDYNDPANNGRIAHPDDWDDLDAGQRGRSLYFTRHIHGPNSTAALLQFWSILAERWLLFGEHELLNRAVSVPAFMDGPARTLHALGAFDPLLSLGASDRGRDQRLRTAAVARVVGRSVA